MAREVPTFGVERVYREHAAVQDIVVFSDQLGQLVALVISEASEADLRGVLDELARRRLPRDAHLVDLVALHPGDPLVSSLFLATGLPRRELIWQFLVGSIETLTMAGHRVSPTHPRQVPAPAPAPEAHPCRDAPPCCGVPDARGG